MCNFILPHSPAVAIDDVIFCLIPHLTLYPSVRFCYNVLQYSTKLIIGLTTL